MKRNWMFGAVMMGAMALGPLAARAGAAVLQDWAGTVLGRTAGTFTDKEGSTVKLSLVPGPRAGEKALEMECHVADWAGAWSLFNDGRLLDLSKTRSVRFAARASQPEVLQVALMDGQKVQYVASVRILSDDWKEFAIPLSFFHRSLYLMPDAPADKPLEWSRLQSLQFQPEVHGDSTIVVGPVAAVRGEVKAETGTGVPEDALLVQDFALLDKSAYGPFTDNKGTSIHLSLKKDPEGKGARLADFRYDLKDGGWCGYWMRAGDVWGGQDWRGAQSMELVVDTREPLQFQVGFNDANQNAYVAQTRPTRGKGWEKVEIPFNHFTLNPFYQPPEARKGAPLDLSHIETFNLAPVTAGPHEFQVRKILLRK